MNIQTRIANTDDTQVLCLLTQQLGYEVDELSIQNALTVLGSMEDTIILVAVVNDIVVGWIQITDMFRLESGRFCEVVGLVVDEQYRRHNVGRKLIEEAKVWSQKRNCKKLRVRANVKRIATQIFYTKCGFEKVKDQHVYDLIVQNI